MKFVRVAEKKFKYKDYIGKYYIDEVPPYPKIRFYNFIIIKDHKKLLHKILIQPMRQEELEKATKNFVKKMEQENEQRYNNQHRYMECYFNTRG